jgi:hypothetical protein
MNPSLIQLSEFVPQNEAEKAIYNVSESEKSIIQSYLDDSKSSWAKGKYYLGGQLRLNPDDEITPELLQKVRDIQQNSDGYYCNSFEYGSVLRANNGFNNIEKIIKKYIEIQKLRILNELEKTKLVSDVNNIIVSYI